MRQSDVPAARATTRNNSDVDCGRAALTGYIKSARLDRVEADQDYTITDAIVSLLKLAQKRGFDPLSLHRSALGHFEAEEPLLWIRHEDGGYRTSWHHGSGVHVFAIQRRGSKFVLTFYLCRSEQDGKMERVGEYDSLKEAKADAQRMKEETL